MHHTPVVDCAPHYWILKNPLGPCLKKIDLRPPMGPQKVVLYMTGGLSSEVWMYGNVGSISS